MSDELKSCPFCGSMVISRPAGEAGYICRRCGSEVYGDWNTRPIEDAMRQRVAELEAENNRLMDAWAVDEAIAADGTLRPILRGTLKRLAEVEAENAALKDMARWWYPASHPPPEWKSVLLQVGLTSYTGYYTGFRYVLSFLDSDAIPDVKFWRELPASLEKE